MSLAATSNRHSRIWRRMWRAAVLLFAVILAILSIGVLSMNLPWTRNFVRTRVNHGISEVFVGQLSIDRIGHLGLDVLGGIDAHLLDAAGNQVISVRGLRVRSNWPQIVQQLIRGRPLNVRLSPLSADHIEVLLVAGRDGTPTLASAFNPRHPNPPGPSDTHVSIGIDGLFVRHIWAHGSLPSLATIDSEVVGFKGKLRNDRAGFSANIDAGHIRARSMPGRLEPDGDITASVIIPPQGAGNSSAAAVFSGFLASAQATLYAQLNAKNLKVILDAPAIPASVIRGEIRSATLRATTSLKAQVHGRLPALEYLAEIDNIEAGHIQVKGDAHLEKTTRASCALRASNVNLAPILSSAPRTRISAEASANLAIEDHGAMHASFRVRLPRSRFDVYETPPASAEGKLSRTESGSLRLNGTLFIDEPGAPIHADYELRAKAGSNPQLHASVHSRLTNPSRLTRIAGVSATGTLVARADLDILARRLSAEANVSLAPAVQERVNAQSLSLQVSARGELDSPYLKIAAVSKEVQASDRHFKEVRLDANGTLKRMHVAVNALDNAEEHIELEASVVPAQGLLVEQPQFAITDRYGQVTGQARAVRVAARHVSVEAFELKGLGSMEATGTFSPQHVDSHFAIHDLDLARLSRLTRLGTLQYGILSLEGHVAGPIDNLQGHLQGQARAVNARGIRGGQFELNVDANNHVLNGTLEGKVGNSSVHAQLADLRLPPSLNSKTLLRDLRGELSISGAFSLDELVTFFGSAGAPIEQASGKVTLDLHLHDAEQIASGPALHAAIKTERLRIVEKRPQQSNVKSPSQAREAEPRALEGIDIDLVLDLDPSGDNSNATLTLFDRLGHLAELKAQTKAPLLTAGDLPAKLRELPFNVNLRIPERALQKWPRSIRPSVMRGLASITLDAQGTLDAPRVIARLNVRQLQSREGKYSVDLQAESRYEKTGGTIEGHARSTRGGSAELQTKWTGNLVDRVRYGDVSDSPPLELSTDLVLRGFPVGVVPAISDRQIRGPLSGEVHLRGLGRDATLQAQLDASGVTINRVGLSRLITTVSADSDKIHATIEALQAHGMAHAQFDSKSSWGQRWVPQIDPHARVQLKAHQFQIAALSPLLLAHVSTLEGMLDADIAASLSDEKPVISGAASVTQGVVQLPEIGQRFSDARAKVSIHEDEVRVDEIQARGITGRLTGDAKVKLNGLELVSASARLNIRENEKLPVTFEGMMIGDAWGHVEFAYSGTQNVASNAAKEIKVDVPQLHLKLPETAQNSVQELSAADNIRIGAHRFDGKFVEVPLQPLESATPEGETPRLTRMLVHLGDAVWVERDRQVKVQLTGSIEVDSVAERKVKGRIELKGGKLDVSGKQFDIERGVVTFEGGDPSNPTITATARWDSPANFTVYAEYAGTVKDGKLKLHSEPTLSQDEILSLLLFGAPDGGMAASSNSNGAIGNIANGSPDQTGGKAAGSSPSGAGTAIGVAGDTATKGLNRAISDVTNLDVSTRIDTSTGSARPELVVQLTPRLTTKVTRAIGEPVPGESPDRTFLTLELRLKRSWALSAVIGDHGASTLDLIWRKRY
jgi:translocation and assembly module TamB